MSNNVTIFAIDDEVDVLELYRKILAKEENSRLDFFNMLEEDNKEGACDLHTFENGEAYLTALKKYYEEDKRVPISIVDMRIPGKHGLEVAKEARKIDPDMVIVIVTAYSDYTVQELMGQLGNRVYYIRKPFKADELYALIHSNLMEWNERKQAKELQKELAVDGTQDGFWSWNPTTNTIYFSPRWKDMIGYEDSEMENKFESWFNCIHVDDRERVMADVQAHLKQQTEYYVNEHRLLCKNGSYKWILARGKALFNENGKPYKMDGFHTDITQRKRLEEELYSVSMTLSKELSEGISKQLRLSLTNTELEKKLKQEILIRRQKEEMLLQQTRQAAMGEMISMIAHQWRQPLTVISLTADNIFLDLQFGTLDNEKLEHALSGIVSQVKYLSETIDDFRQFFVPNKDKENMLLHECLEGAYHIIGPSLLSKNIKVEKLYEDTTRISLYKNELVQVFINFLKNAQDAFIDNPVKNAFIKLHTREYEDYVEVLISDNAGGIPIEIQQQIFEPYFTTKSKKNGTGLGLYMSKTIIQDHSCGSIKVDNIDKGVLFTIQFPKECSEPNR